jgi:methylated-DNA-[protein]-cysteine S-methyltransferase
MTTWTTTIDSPVGPLLLAADDDGALTHLLFGDEARPAALGAGVRADPAPFAALVAQLDEYFAGARRVFDVPLAPAGTPFQREAWTALRTIPYGETRSYGAQAAAIGRPRASRAVGAANGRNPIAIVVPCHRVVGADGTLTGYGGGVATKRWLLAHEQQRAGQRW